MVFFREALLLVSSGLKATWDRISKPVPERFSRATAVERGVGCFRVTIKRRLPIREPLWLQRESIASQRLYSEKALEES